MNSMHRWLLIAALTAVVAALGAACDGEETEGKSLCDGVDCAAPLTCDPSDGVCKCGTGDSRMICKSNEVCVVTAEGVPFCTEDRCVGVVCDRNETCDPTDGVCKCGATTCSEGEICVQNRCGVPDPCAGQACPEGQTCDSTDGRCKCGGEICADNESCVDGVCVDDPCKGVNCPQNSVCNPVDRACHCGTETGPVCETGQACVNEEGDWICRGARDKCEAVACSGDAVCDLDTGACCCGGTGDACVVCEEGQLCYRGECTGRIPCQYECEPGYVCNPEKDQCECGGQLCQADQTCMALDGENWQCVNRCDPWNPNSCGEGLACYIDLMALGTTGYCAPPGENGDNDRCDLPHDCEPGFTCVGSSNKVCRQLCDEPSDCGDAALWGCTMRGDFGFCNPL
ncbi:MAG: hypothetical protein DIU72_003525 [Pseudomonadota bacterium]|nr:MAG: hypothetical protein DIU72_05795 [Pseudomonadota bacterium]